MPDKNCLSCLPGVDGAGAEVVVTDSTKLVVLEVFGKDSIKGERRRDSAVGTH